MPRAMFVQAAAQSAVCEDSERLLYHHSGEGSNAKVHKNRFECKVSRVTDQGPLLTGGARQLLCCQDRPLVYHLPTT